MKTKRYEIELEHFGKVYVSKEVKELLEEDERIFQNYERKCRYWCPVRLDECEYEGELFVDDYDPKKEYLEKEEQLECNRFLELLTPTQKRRLLVRMEKNITSVDERYREVLERLSKVEEGLDNTKKVVNEIKGG